MSDTPEASSDAPPMVEGDTARDTPSGPGGPLLSLGEAQRSTGAARSTIQRRLNAGQIPGAHRTEAGGWAIPISGLIAAGLAPRVSPPDPEPPPEVDPEADTLRAELAATRAELDRVRAEAEYAHRLAVERGQHVADLRAALEAMARALPPAPDLTEHAASSVTPPAEIVADPPLATPTTPAPRRRWWQRGPA